MNHALEKRRLLLQQRLDAEKKSLDRNKLGQFATPTELALNIIHYAQTLLTDSISDSEKIRFLDPAFGTGSFYSALLQTFPQDQIERAWGYEIDSHYGKAASNFWDDHLLKLNLDDFTRVKAPTLEEEKFNLIICNPPYVRHHHIKRTEKKRLRQRVKLQTDYRLNGLAGLYCYFLLLSQSWMSANGLAGWLLPTEFLEVKYGQIVKQFLLKKVTLLHIHRFDAEQIQFEDALVSSAIVWFINTPPPTTHQIKFSFGNTLMAPKRSMIKPITTLDSKTKWTRFLRNRSHKRKEKFLKLSDLFTIKRGIATGANKFFILNAKQRAELELPQECIRPILPSPRYLDGQEIEADHDGYPKIQKQLFLLDCKLPETVIKKKYPSVWNYLQTGIKQDIHKRYLCRHRSPWYAQEYRPVAPIVCTYMGRFSQTQNRPFRFILNHSKATAPNVYLLLYPKLGEYNSQSLRSLWKLLQQIEPYDLVAEGRVYGGGLYKIEPSELANVKVKEKDFLEIPEAIHKIQLSLF